MWTIPYNIYSFSIPGASVKNPAAFSVLQNSFLLSKTEHLSLLTLDVINVIYKWVMMLDHVIISCCVGFVETRNDTSLICRKLFKRYVPVFFSRWWSDGKIGVNDREVSATRCEVLCYITWWNDVRWRDYMMLDHVVILCYITRLYYVKSRDYIMSNHVIIYER